jgi:hypothetical protein
MDLLKALNIVGIYLENRDILHLCITNKVMFTQFSPMIDTRYNTYIKSDKYKSRVVLELNKLSFMIDQFKFNNKILTNLMFDYLMGIYEHWAWIVFDESYYLKVKPPGSKHFSFFLNEKRLTMNDILPTVRFNYTHHHRPTKQFSYFKTICSIHSQSTS